MPADLSNATLGQVALRVKDLDRAVAFYRDTLGLPFLFQVPNLAFFNCGVRLMLEVANEEGEQFNSLLYYKVDDIQATYETLRKRGVSFDTDGGVPHKVADMEDHELWMAFLRDSEENLVGIMCELRNS